MRPPFDVDRLDALMDAAGLDVVLATSRHNVRYLLNSYSQFHESFDAIGVDRHLPVVGYRAGAPDQAFAIASPIDRHLHAVAPLWTPAVIDESNSAVDSARIAAEQLRRLGLERGRCGVELSFAPHSFTAALAAELPGATLVEAAAVLDELRAVKNEQELAYLRVAAEGIVDSIRAAVERTGAGSTKRQVVDRLRIEEESRRLRFEYCLIAAGADFNRAVSERRWERGEILSVDSGGQYRGYIGDLCRMAVSGPPSARAKEVLAEVRAVQDAARAPVRAGAVGGEIYAAADAVLRQSPHRAVMNFVAHGMGLVPHEPPRLTSTGPIHYPASHRDKPLEAGMVLSIETDARVGGLGLVKVEDTVVVTAQGWEAYGDSDRDWIVVD